MIWNKMAELNNETEKPKKEKLQQTDKHSRFLQSLN